ncbi:hypothetical protein RJ639_000762 [Escallonia herrerae]|uniref:Glycosyltransferase 61 catalytic domain-containing protein n=1 Tax=Escallonia herrerae TaxID=1293975 RepID=A0AA89BG98_9ASTE|nr:hypothetical protein RJ639_000762 [Escallonia herrerae]
MSYDAVLSRSFSRHDQKKLGWAAFFGCVFVSSFMHDHRFDTLVIIGLGGDFGGGVGGRRWGGGSGGGAEVNLSLSAGVNLKSVLSTEEVAITQSLATKIKEAKPICDYSQRGSDVCEMDGDVRIQGNSSTIFVASFDSDIVARNTTSWHIRPYARKEDQNALNYIRQFTVRTAMVSGEDLPLCTHNHSVPAIVFSVGGYAGNHFHDFSDVLIPLYLTSREFNGDVKFLIANHDSSWTHKHKEILEKLSRHEIINIDKEDGVHCFPRMIVGLKHHKEFSIDPSRSQYSMKDFRQFLRSSYSLNRETATKLRDGEGNKRPRLLIITRKRSRSFNNEGEIVNMAQSLGFEVVVTEAKANLSQFSHIVNSCDVMMGVHGAGLTNIVFLPENGILIQVLPLGGMEWLAKTYFGEPARDMNIRYLEYKINESESSLIQEFPLHHEVFRDPYGIQRKGWGKFRSIYLDRQNVKLDVGRFQETLLKALQLLRD